MLGRILYYVVVFFQVWASGFSAAFLKKNSVATKGSVSLNYTGIEASIGRDEPAATEAALLLILRKFFEVVLNIPAVNRYLLLFNFL